MTGIQVLDLVGNVQTALSSVAPSSDDVHSLGQTDIANRFVWIFEEVITSDLRALSRPIGSAVSIFTDEWRIKIHCWGADKADSFRMRQALITCLREAAATADLGIGIGSTSFKGGEGITTNGFVSIVDISVLTECFEAQILTGGVVVDRKGLTTRAQYAEIQSTGTAGDGRLGTLEEQLE